MKSIKTISDPKAFELLADDTRRKVIYLLRVKEMTVSQIASDLGLTAQAIYHHIRKLKAAEMVEVSKEVRVGHFIETYYRSASEMFILSHGQARMKHTNEELARGTLEGLAKLGVITSPDPALVAKVSKLIKQMDGCCPDSDLSDRIGAMDDVPFFVKQSMTEIAHVLTEDDDQFEYKIKLQRELRELLGSRTTPQTKAKPKKK